MIHDSPSDYATNPPHPFTHSDDGLIRTSIPPSEMPYAMGRQYGFSCEECDLGKHLYTYLGDDGVTGLWRWDQ